MTAYKLSISIIIMGTSESKEDLITSAKYLRELKDDYLDDIPDEILHSNSPGPGNYKVRASWWQQLYTEVDILDLKGALSPELKEKYESVKINYSKSTENQGPVKPENIDEANVLLSNLIGDLETKVSSRTLQ